MALIDKIKKGFKEKENVHKPTECSYFIIHNKSGEKYLQLDTYGSSDRAITGKVSQSMQFSLAAIEQLKAILLKEF